MLICNKGFLFFHLFSSFMFFFSVASILDEEVYLCGSHHTCVGRCGSWKEGCSCDDICESFNDCCFDYHQLCLNPQQDQHHLNTYLPFPRKVHYSQYDCHDFSNVHIFVVSKCSPYWTDDFVKRACHQRQHPQDLLQSTPVYDDDGVVYRNTFCALCNDVTPSRLTTYQILLTDRNNQSQGMQTQYLGGVVFPEGDLGIPRTCSVTPYFCRYSDIDLCLAYHAPIAWNYRNPSCLACDRYVSTYCLPAGCDAEYPSCEDPRRSTLYNLFDFSLIGENLHEQCDRSLGELFDPFLQACRFMGCPQGHFYSLGQCLEGDLPYGAPQVVLKKTLPESMECIKSALSRSEMEIEGLYVTPISGNLTSKGPFLVLVVSESVLASFSVKLTLDALLLSISGRYEIYYKCATATFFLLINQTSQNITKNDCYLGDVSFDSVPTELTNFETFQNLFSYEYNPSMERFVRHGPSDACWDSLNLNLECSEESVINPGDFLLSPSTFSVVVTVNSVEIIISNGEFQMMRNGSLRVCSSALRVTHSLFQIFYTSCVVASLIALLCTFITYQTFKKLRNVPGLCVMNLVAALFVANLLFLFSSELVHLPTVCTMVGAFSHFTWLASFAWMSVLSYNMARTFGTHSMQLHSVANTRKRVLKFSLYAWGLPGLIAISCLAMHYCKECTGEFVFRYGGFEACWIEDGFAVLVSVGVPVGTMLFFDLAVFLYTGISLRKTRYSTKHIRTNSAFANDLLVELAVNTRVSWLSHFAHILTVNLVISL